MKKALTLSLLLTLCISFFSCSVTFEKRKYMKGYYFNVVHKNNRSSAVAENPVATDIKPNPVQFQKILIKPQLPGHKKLTLDSLKSNNIQKNSIETKNHLPFTKKKFYRYEKHFNKKLIKKDITSKKNRKIMGWILGGIAILFFILGLFLAIFASGFSGLGAGLGLLAGSVFIAIFALILGLTKSKKEKIENPTVHTAVKDKFKTAGFIMSIIAMALGAIGFLLGFFIYPIGVIGWFISCVALLLAIISFSFGFRALKDDKSIKTKLTIIFGFIAFLLAGLGGLLIFI